MNKLPREVVMDALSICFDHSFDSDLVAMGWAGDRTREELFALLIPKMGEKDHDPNHHGQVK